MQAKQSVSYGRPALILAVALVVLCLVSAWHEQHASAAPPEGFVTLGVMELPPPAPTAAHAAPSCAEGASPASPVLPMDLEAVGRSFDQQKAHLDAQRGAGRLSAAAYAAQVAGLDYARSRQEAVLRAFTAVQGQSVEGVGADAPGGQPREPKRVELRASSLDLQPLDTGERGFLSVLVAGPRLWVLTLAGLLLAAAAMHRLWERREAIRGHNRRETPREEGQRQHDPFGKKREPSH